MKSHLIFNLENDLLTTIKREFDFLRRNIGYKFYVYYAHLTGKKANFVRNPFSFYSFIGRCIGTRKLNSPQASVCFLTKIKHERLLKKLFLFSNTLRRLYCNYIYTKKFSRAKYYFIFKNAK
jgi:hypothetical protein